MLNYEIHLFQSINNQDRWDGTDQIHRQFDKLFFILK